MKRSYVSAFMLALGLASCVTPSDSTIEPPPELITHVMLTLKDSANVQDSVVARFTDPDGPTGSVQPVITGVTLKVGHTYFGSITLLEVNSELVDSVTNVTDEVRTLNAKHQLFYSPKGALAGKIGIEILDKDDRGLPLGLAYTVRVAAGSSGITGSLNVVLSHYEIEGTKNGVTRSDESDIDIDFSVTVQ